MKNKKGNISITLTVIISLFFLIMLGVYIINTITPFIWYQKLDNIANKYVYIVEKFGYLTDKEEKNLYEDLGKAGFDIQNVNVSFPKYQLEFGELFKFEIKYVLDQKNTKYVNGIINEVRQIPLHIEKYSYSKV